MKHDQVLRIKSLNEKKKKRAILSAAKHNLRELPPEAHIDADRSHLNRVLYGPETAAEVAHLAKSMMAAASIKLRAVNTILGVEVLVCLPASFDGDAMAFFSDSLAWADEFFQVPCLSAVAHFDEPAPHLHILLLPLVDEKLDGRAVMGDMKRIQTMQGDFYDSVGKKHGLRRKAAVRLSKDERCKGAQNILDVITANPDLLNGGQVKSLLLDVIGQNLEAFSASVGVAMPEPKAKASKETFVSIMTKPQKPERKRSAIAVPQTSIGVSGPVVAPQNGEAISDKTANCYALIALQISEPEKEPVIDAPDVSQVEPACAPIPEPVHRPEKECSAAPLSTATLTDDPAGTVESDSTTAEKREQPAPHEPSAQTDATHDTHDAAPPMPDAHLVQVDDGDFERVRDDELDPGEWDADRGEFVRRLVTPSRKAEAAAAVQGMLASAKRPPGPRRWRISSP